MFNDYDTEVQVDESPAFGFDALTDAEIAEMNAVWDEIEREFHTSTPPYTDSGYYEDADYEDYDYDRDNSWDD
jgi:hypothetical protein